MKSFQWTDAEVQAALGVSGDGGGERIFPRVWTDTRTIQDGDLFIALRGENFDAHEYLAKAAEAGATGAVVSRIPADAPEGLRYFVVENTLHALGRLGRHRRRAHAARVVGVVGSNGKTTTKDLLRTVLQTRYRVHATQGNLNNQVGVPLTLLSAPADAEVLVVEMGTNEPGEIAILTSIVEPEAGVITSIGEEHLEKLGDLEGVLREEVSILPGLARAGTVFVAEEPEALAELARAAMEPTRVHVAGFSDAADLRPDGGADGVEIQPDGTTRWSWRGHAVHLPLPGRWNVRNALLALGVAVDWGVPTEEAAAALAGTPAPKMRGEWRTVGGVRLLADCYNANPPSLIAAVELLSTLPTNGRKVAVIGTMRELGDRAAAIHREAAETVARAAERGIDLVVATGDFVPAFEPLAGAMGDRLVLAEDPVEAYDAVASRLDGSETILLKGSRGVALERWIPLLERDFGASV